MRPETTSTHGDLRAVATVGMAMAVLSAAVAASGIAIPLPAMIYRAAAMLGSVVELFEGGEAPRETALVGVVSLTPDEVADRNAREEAGVRLRWTREGALTRARPSVPVPVVRPAARTREPVSARPAETPVPGTAGAPPAVDDRPAATETRTTKAPAKPKEDGKKGSSGTPTTGDGTAVTSPPQKDAGQEPPAGSGTAAPSPPSAPDTTPSPEERAPCPKANGNGRAYGLCK